MYAPPVRPKSYFSFTAYSAEEGESADGRFRNYKPVEIRANAQADEIIVTQGSQNENGEIIGAGRGLRFAVHDEDAANRRESGNIMFSSILGIGIALLTEAFVILLAVGALSLRRKEPVSVE